MPWAPSAFAGSRHPHPVIAEALAKFGGVGRRFERKGERAGGDRHDDYGHHPARSRPPGPARPCFPTRLVGGLPAPRFSRTKALFGEFCTCFGAARPAPAHRDLSGLRGAHSRGQRREPGQGIRQVSRTDVTYFRDFAAMEQALPASWPPATCCSPWRRQHLAGRRALPGGGRWRLSCGPVPCSRTDHLASGRPRPGRGRLRPPGRGRGPRRGPGRPGRAAAAPGRRQQHPGRRRRTAPGGRFAARQGRAGHPAPAPGGGPDSRARRGRGQAPGLVACWPRRACPPGGLVGVPGTVGGAVAGNAGSYGDSLGAVLARVRVWSPETAWPGSGREGFSTAYRRFALPGVAGFFVVLEAELDMAVREPIELRQEMVRHLSDKKASQPSPRPRGCVFRSAGRVAWRLLAEADFGGERLGGVGFFREARNFLVNYGEGRAGGACACPCGSGGRAGQSGLELELEVRGVP